MFGTKGNPKNIWPVQPVCALYLHNNSVVPLSSVSDIKFSHHIVGGLEKTIMLIIAYFFIADMLFQLFKNILLIANAKNFSKYKYIYS